MKSRIVFFIVTFLAVSFIGIEKLSAQDNYPDPLVLNIDENTGVKGKIFYTKKINGWYWSNYYKNLSLQVISGYIVNEVDGTTANIPNKKIRLVNTYGSGSTPSMNDLNFKGNPVQLRGDQTIVSSYRRGATGYSTNDEWTFEFEVDIAGGENLKNLSSGRYSMDITFRLTIEYGWLFSSTSTYESRSELKFDYSKLELANEIVVNAKQVALSLATVDDYTGGISKTFNNGLSVTYNTGYKVNVHTTNAEFNNSTIPVNVVDMKIDGSPAFGTSRGAKPLSTNATTLYQGMGTNGKSRNLDIHYYIKPENARKLLTYDPDVYETTLIYTLLPQ